MNQSIKPNPIAININFDSLAEVYGFPNDFHDPTFFEGFEKVITLIRRYGLKLTIFIIGRDLKNPENFARVREWARDGIEIGNHSWSHPVNLGNLKSHDIYDEVCRAHEIITKCTDKEPKGFISPAWSTSGKLISVLIDLKYEYDTSLFPSLFLYPMIFKMILNHFRNPQRVFKIMNRKDWFQPVKCSLHPRFIDGNFNAFKKPALNRLLCLPLPNDNIFYPPLWHTLGFVFGWRYLEKRMIKLLNDYDSFYYLLHPADYLGSEMILDSGHALERMNISSDIKLKMLDKIFNIISNSGRPCVTMGELAKHTKSMISEDLTKDN